MKINWNFSITLQWVHIPVIPFISFAEIKPVVVVQTIPAPEAEILPIPAPQVKPTGKGTEHTKEREYDPNLRYRRGKGTMAGTEAYRAIHVRRDLIQWFIDRKNNPLTLRQMRIMKKSPFRHAWVKCELTCDHKIVSTVTLRRVLRNERTAKEKAKGTPQVITFAKTKKKAGDKRKAAFSLDKDLYKNLIKEIGTLNVPEYQLPTPPIQTPAETETIRAYVRENSNIRR